MIFGRHINKYYLKYLWVLLIGILALIAVDYFQLKIPEIYGEVIDGLDPTTETVLTVNRVEQLCLTMLGVVGVMVVGRFLWRICFFGSAIKVERDIRLEMFNHCKDLSQSFYQVNKVGNMMSLFTNDLETINECFGDGVLMAVDALSLGGLAIYKMTSLNPTLALLAMIPILLMGAISVIVGKYMMKKWELRQEAFSQLSDFAQESFSGIAVIKAFVKETKELLAFRKVNRNNENANVNFVRASTLLMIFVTLFVQSVIAIILGVGGYYAYIGRFSSAQLIMFLSYFSSVIWPVMAISRLIEMSSRGKASLKRIGDLLDHPIDVKDVNVRDDVDSIKGKIEFKNLTFRYPGAEYDSLKDVSFVINQGENVGIIGKTGAGKTTIVDLILRTYNVPDETVYIDGYDINRLPIKLVRQYAAYVPQDNFLFSDTIGKNIAFANAGQANLEDIIRVSKIADLDDNINKKFPDKYDTMLGERGVTISGGQKQRASIARALLKDASILILDDSVSAVDTKTEKVILDNLKETRKNKTTILIAHRISTIENMDKIIFVDDGKIIAVGNHNDLYNTCNDYKIMVDLQRLEDELGGAN